MIYPPGIVFEPQPLTVTTSTWLDIDVHLSRKRGLVLSPLRRELPWVRGESKVCQNLLPPLSLLSRTWIPLCDHPLDAASPFLQSTSGHTTSRTTPVAQNGTPNETPSRLVSNHRKSSQIRCFTRALLKDRSTANTGPTEPDTLVPPRPSILFILKRLLRTFVSHPCILSMTA